MHLSPLLSAAAFFKMFKRLVIISHIECPCLWWSLCSFLTLSRMSRSRRWRQRRKWTFWWAATCTQQHSPPSPSPSPGRRLAGCSEKTKRLVLQLLFYYRCYHDISSPITTTFTKSAVGHRVSPGCGIFSSLPQRGSWKVDKFSGRVRKWKANNARVSSQMYIRMCVTSIAIHDGFQLV